MNCKVSIVLPVYNVEQYLEECLDSLLNQTTGEFEVIAINDGSTDNSLAILEKYRAKFKCINIISHSNSGLSATRNVGINNAIGEYVLFLDSDDMLESTAVESLYDLAHENKLNLVVCDGLRMDEILGKVDNNMYCRRKIFNNEVLSKEEFIEGSIKKGMLHAQFHFYKKQFIIENNLRFSEGILHEDELFSMNTYALIDRVGYCDKQIYIRRYRYNSIMSSNLYKNEKSFNSYKYVLNEFNKIKHENSHDNTLVTMVNHRGALIMNNLIRYKGINISDILKIKKDCKFNFNIPRIIANIIVYKVYRPLKRTLLFNKII